VSKVIIISKQETNRNFLANLSRKIRVSDYRNQRLKESQNLGYFGMDEMIPKKKIYLVPPLPLVEETQEDGLKTETIEFLLKQRAGGTSTSPSYKLKVQRFCEGTVGEWIAVRKAIKELWTQNSILSQADRIANISAILRGESLTGFEEKIEELTHLTDAQGAITTIAVTEAMVEAGLNAVAETVFPFRALETQKLWMRRGMKKPKELSFRKTAAAVGRLNNCLPLFPQGSESDKFSTTELVELLEWSIPQSWRTKFDLDGYVPTGHGKERLITECEAIERNEPKQSSGQKSASKSTVHKKNRGNVKNRHVDKSKDLSKSYYCTEHGKNPTHNTDKCYTIKNRASKANGSTGKSLTKTSFRREINAMAKKGRPKKKILEMFATVLQQEHTRLSKSKKTKNTTKKDVAEDSSDSDMSVESTNEIHAMDSAGDEKDSLKNTETDEEQTYRETIENLGTITDSK
jgi:hypothetical protein